MLVVFRECSRRGCLSHIISQSCIQSLIPAGPFDLGNSPTKDSISLSAATVSDLVKGKAVEGNLVTVA